MKKTKLLSLALALALALTAFTGCSSKGENGESGESDAQDGTNDALANIESEFNLSEYFDDNGWFKDINSADYITLPDYKSVVVPKANYIPGEATVQMELEQLLAKYTTTNSLKEGVIKAGDKVNIDYVGKVDGVAFNGGSTNGQGTVVTAGSNEYIDDFLTQIIGHEVGESFDIEVTFPENYGNEELNGKDAVFTIKINSIEETIVPELTDEFCASNFAEYNTVEKFMAQFKENISRDMVNSYMYTNVFDKAEIGEIPQFAMDFVNTYVLSTYEMQALAYGMELDEMLLQMGFDTRDDLVEYISDDAKILASDYLIMTAIAQNEDIKITDKMVDEYFEEVLGGANREAVEKLYGTNYLKFTVLQNEVVNYLVDETPREK